MALKVGDRIRNQSNQTNNPNFGKYGRVKSIKTMTDGGKEMFYIQYDDGREGSGYENAYVPASENPKVNYILQYELDEDPFETFETMKEVKDRIRMLTELSELKKDSINVYTVSSVQKVTLDVAISFSTVEEVKEVKGEKKTKKSNARSLGQKRRYARIAAEKAALETK